MVNSFEDLLLRVDRRRREAAGKTCSIKYTVRCSIPRYRYLYAGGDKILVYIERGINTNPDQTWISYLTTREH